MLWITDVSSLYLPAQPHHSKVHWYDLIYRCLHFFYSPWDHGYGDSYFVVLAPQFKNTVYRTLGDGSPHSAGSFPLVQVCLGFEIFQGYLVPDLECIRTKATHILYCVFQTSLWLLLFRLGILFKNVQAIHSFKLVHFHIASLLCLDLFVSLSSILIISLGSTKLWSID